MILSKIDNRLSIYRRSKVYLFGVSVAGLKIKSKLEEYGISVTAFVDNDVNK